MGQYGTKEWSNLSYVERNESNSKTKKNFVTESIIFDKDKSVERHIIPEKLHETLINAEKKLPIDKIMQKY